MERASDLGYLPFFDVCSYHAREYEAKGWTRKEIPPRAAPIARTPTVLPSSFAAGRRDALDALERRIASACAPIWTEATARGKGAAEAIRAVLGMVREERARCGPVAVPASPVSDPVPSTIAGGPTP